METEIVCESTGELIDVTDADALIDHVNHCRREVGKLMDLKRRCEQALTEMSDGDAKTRRIITAKGRTLKLEFPSATFQSALLLEAWNSYPDHRDTYLRIGTIAASRREINKLRETTGAIDFEQFKKMVLRAERESDAPPKVTIEKDVIDDSLPPF